MQAGSDDMRRRIIVVVILGIVGLVGVGALLAGMYSVIDTAGEIRRRADGETRGRRATDADPESFEKEIAAALDARIATLPDEAREMATELRAAAGVDACATFVDHAVRLELADRVVRAAFDGTSPPAAADSVVPGALATPALAQARVKFGRMLARSRIGGRSGLSPTPRADTREIVASTTFLAWFERGFAEVETRFVYAGRAEWRIESVDVRPAEPSADEARPDESSTEPPDSAAGAAARGLVKQTCETCRAIRFGRPGDAWRIAGDRAGHVHLWRAGASSGLQDTVKDGTIVLVKRAAEIAAIVVRRQTSSPERVTFDWAYRNDGGTVLDPADPAVATGTVVGAAAFDFRGIRVDWSIAGDAAGWIYYPRGVGDEVRPGDLRLCVTNVTELSGLDAADPRWVFRGSPSDEGVRAR